MLQEDLEGTAEALIEFIESKQNSNPSVLDAIERLLLLDEKSDLIVRFSIYLVQSGFLSYSLIASKHHLTTRIFSILNVTCNYDVRSISTISGPLLSF